MKRRALAAIDGGMAGVPKAPAWLPEAGVAEWKRVAPELQRRGALGREIEGILATYCSAIATVRQCEEALAKEGLTFTGSDGFARPHPLLNAKAKASGQALQLAKRLGLLNKAGAPVQAKEVDPDDPWA